MVSPRIDDMMKKLTLTLLLISLYSFVQAQSQLPEFTVKKIAANRIVISWVNPFPNMSQISIQRSFDSGKNFKTILSVADPKAIQNGFADSKAPNDSMYYRLFYATEGGSFYFTAAKRPPADTSSSASSETAKPITAAIDSATIKKIEAFTPSFYVYTLKDGYVFINLPDADKTNYHIRFYEEDGTFLFEIKGVKQTALTLDKANFYHGGWFNFELFRDEKLVEKHKFYLPKDF
jgi:hypothetical protein